MKLIRKIKIPSIIKINETFKKIKKLISIIDSIDINNDRVLISTSKNIVISNNGNTILTNSGISVNLSKQIHLNPDINFKIQDNIETTEANIYKSIENKKVENDE